MSTVDTRPVPTNIFARPRIRDLIMQHKAIYAYLYYCPEANACGCYLFSCARGAADLSMTEASLEDALDEFARRGLIDRDKTTGEIWVLDWPRSHRFATPAARGALWASIAKVQSGKLWTTVKRAYESIPEPGKGKGKEKDKDKASSKEEECSEPTKAEAPKPTYSKLGILCWTPADLVLAASLEDQYGEEGVRRAVTALTNERIAALPMRVAAQLKPSSKLPNGWWKSEETTMEAGKIIGLDALPGQSMAQYKAAIRAKLAIRDAEGNSL